MALAAGHADGLDAASEAFASIGTDLYAAECATAAASIHRERGAARSAAASASRAAELLARCEGSSTPALRTVPVRNRLTRRETEVARLAASGLSNREIADELIVSVRTVENHLQRAYDKLGVGSRDDLGAALERSSTD